MRPWRAWYDDGSVYDSAHHQWVDLPTDGLQVVMFYLEPFPYREIVHGLDEYTFDGVTKYGRWMETNAYWKLVGEAFKTREVPE